MYLLLETACARATAANRGGSPTRADPRCPSPLGGAHHRVAPDAGAGGTPPKEAQAGGGDRRSAGLLPGEHDVGIDPDVPGDRHRASGEDDRERLDHLVDVHRLDSGPTRIEKPPGEPGASTIASSSRLRPVVALDIAQDKARGLETLDNWNATAGTRAW